MSTGWLIFLVAAYLINGFFILGLLGEGTYSETWFEYAFRLVAALTWPIWLLPLSLMIGIGGVR